MLTTKALEERTKELFALIDTFGADVDLKNAVTGECVKPDAASMFAGMQAGLVVASGLADMKKPTKQDYFAAMLSGIETAAKLFIRRKEREWDKMAEECAQQIKAEGREDA